MDTIKKLFPHAFKATEIKPFAVALIIYVLIDVVCGFIIGLLSQIPLIGILFSVIGYVVGLYALVGIILSVLVFAKVVK